MIQLEDFFSANHYLYLPTRHNPRAILAIDSNGTAKNSFKLYNPFSTKAKIFKSVVVFATKYFKPFCSMFLPMVKVEQSEFSKYLNSTLNKQLTISSYIATERDKLVLQLQDEQSKIYGYLKFPTTETGKQRVLNEKHAINILSNHNIIPKLLFDSSYQDTPFIILKNIEGIIKRVPDNSYKNVLTLFYKQKEYSLLEHPRVIGLLHQLNELGLNEHSLQLQNIIKKSSGTYKEVYEHGDFAPWNLIQTSTGIIPIDFEYFVENGLEYLDEIKYHFQINYLLNGLIGLKLINTIRLQVPIEEFDIVFQIFLLKEIVNKQSLNESITLEESLLKTDTNHA